MVPANRNTSSRIKHTARRFVVGLCRTCQRALVKTPAGWRCPLAPMVCRRPKSDSQE